MMETISWIFVGLLTVSLFLFIFALIKKMNIMKCISRAFILPFANVIILIFLKQQLPEAEHILFLSVIAIGLITISEIFFSFENINICKIFGRFFFLASNFAWIELYITTFFIYRPLQWHNILAITIYSIILITTLILSGKNKFGIYLSIILGYLTTIVLNYSAVITLIFSKKSYSIYLTAGTFILMAVFIFYFLQKTRTKKISSNIEDILRISLITIAEGLITTSGIFMIMN